MPISGLDESRARLEQLRASLDLPAKEEELRVLEAQSGREDFWDDADKARWVPVSEVLGMGPKLFEDHLHLLEFFLGRG